jgi:pectin methylesterase-like acyl-CoA thioesterase
VIGWVASKETIGNVVIESSALDEGTYLLEIWSDSYERDIDSYILGSYEFDSKEDFSLQLSIDQSSFAYKIYRIES